MSSGTSSPVSTDELWEAMRTARAIRRYRPEPVDRAVAEVVGAAAEIDDAERRQGFERDTTCDFNRFGCFK